MLPPGRFRFTTAHLVDVAMVCSFVLITFAAGDSHSQALISAHNLVEVHNSFQSALDGLAARWHVAIVAESSPIVKKAGAELSSSLPNETADQAVSRVAAAFDYNAEVLTGVYVLTKRFSDQKDLPDITLGEAVDALEGISSIVAPFDTKFNYEPRPSEARAFALANALSSEQLSALGTTGVPISSLSQSQREVVWKFALQYYVSNVAREAADSLAILRSVADHGSSLHWSKVYGIDEFGFDLPSGSPERFRPLSHPYSMVVGANGHTTRLIRTSPDNPGEVEFDPTAPAANTGVTRANPPSGSTQTIGSTSDWINARADDKTKWNVDDSLRSKAVTCVGLSLASSEQLAAGMAQLYCLDIRHARDGAILILRPRPRTISETTELRSALTEVISGPVRRYTEARTRLGDSEFSPPLHVGLESSSAAYTLAAKSARITAIHQIRTTVEPLILRFKDTGLRFSELDEDTTKEFVFSQCVSALALAVWTGQREIPPYIADFAHIILTGGVARDSAGQTRLTVMLSYRDPKSGQLRVGVGMSNAIIPGR